MRAKVFYFIVTWGLSHSINAQETKYPIAQDVESVDGLVSALYASISGDAGEPRDWERFKSLFADGALLIPTKEKDDGTNGYKTMTPLEYIENAGPYFQDNGFYEYELYRETNDYGRITHIFSTYASKHGQQDAEPFNRGINSIQLFYDGNRWWILNVYWAHESEKNPISDRYLPK